jgi:4'-phosphopantetheinyl transferase
MNKAFVYYTVFEDVHEPIREEFIHALPKKMADEIIQYKKQGDINRLTAGKYLLKHLVNACGFSEEIFSSYKIDEMGKPFIKGFHPFNITHSGKVVACAVLPLEGNIGIDVEKIREIEVIKFDKQFSPPEMMRILAGKDAMQTFFDFWTMKEAVMKADGRGMRIPLHSIRLKEDHATIDDTGTKWNLYPLELDKSVKAHICSDHELTLIQPKFYSVTNLFC